jgi:hypothetical protein
MSDTVSYSSTNILHDTLPQHDTLSHVHFTPDETVIVHSHPHDASIDHSHSQFKNGITEQNHIHAHQHANGVVHTHWHQHHENNYHEHEHGHEAIYIQNVFESKRMQINSQSEVDSNHVTSKS